jgi:hypothetical protein
MANNAGVSTMLQEGIDDSLAEPRLCDLKQYFFPSILVYFAIA